MVRVNGPKVISRPIAGTRRRGKTEEDDRRMAGELREDPKEVAEHVMLVDLARNDVGRIARFGTVHVDELIFHSPRPVSAATALCAERGVGLLVFGPSRKAAGRWRYRSWSRKVRRDTPCLVWLPDD